MKETIIDRELQEKIFVVRAWASTIVSLGNPAFAAHRGMASMGLVPTVGMILTVATTLWFLPALLRWLERGKTYR